MPIILESPTPPSPSPSPGADREGFVLDGLDLNDGATRTLIGLDFTPAKKLLEFIKGPDADGAKLLRLARHENSEFDIRILIRNSTRNTVLDTVGGIIDKLQEAERLAASGGRGQPLVWTPMGSTYSYTFYVLAAETSLIRDDLYKLGKPYFDAKLYCSPFGYGPEVTTSTTTSSLPLITMTVADVPGDVPAELRITVTDAAGQSRDYVCVGLENFNYDAGTALLIDSASFVTSGFSGSTTTRTGAYSSDGVVRATLTTTPVAVCSSAELTHRGTFRNLFRLWPSSTNISVRMAWRQGRDQWTAEPWHTPPFEDNFWEVDLGQSKIRQALLGTQTWQWRIEAKSTVAGDTLDVDFHAMIPSGEGYGKVRRTVGYETPTTFITYDTFVQSAGALTGKAAPSGQTWTVVASSDADDFSVETTGATAQRTATGDASPRMVTAGTTAYAASGAQVDLKASVVSTNLLQGGVLLRSVDIDDYVMGGTISSTSSKVGVVVSVAGNAEAYSTPYTLLANTNYTTRLVVYANGTWAFWFYPQSSVPSSTPLLQGYRSELATGGVLDDGKVGLYEFYGSATANTRNYDNFMAFVPTTDVAVSASQSGEFRSYGDDPYLREDSTGSYWGKPGEVRGGRLWLPPAGDDDRTTRLAFMARRTDIEEHPSGNFDSTSVTAHYRPRWINVPRQA